MNDGRVDRIHRDLQALNFVARTRLALQTLGDIDKELNNEAVFAKLTPDELLQIGQRIWWMTKRLNRAFEPIKCRLRELALATSNGVPGSQRFESPDGSHAIVTVQPVAPTLRKEADMERVRAILGSKFDEVFDTTITYRLRKDVDVLSLEQDEQDAVMVVLDMTDNPPKVAFKD